MEVLTCKTQYVYAHFKVMSYFWGRFLFTWKIGKEANKSEIIIIDVWLALTMCQALF